jgi:hypothetical protein
MITGYLENVDVTIMGLERFGAQAKQYAFGGIVNGLKIAYAASLKLISVHDYSLADLAEMGHPYGHAVGVGGEFGRDVDTGRQVGNARGTIPFAIEETVEVQTMGKGTKASGESYLGALHVTKPVGTMTAIMEGKISIEGDDAAKELDRWLQEGTTHMVARPWMEYVVKEYGIEILDAMNLAIMAGMKRDWTRWMGGEYWAL